MKRLPFAVTAAVALFALGACAEPETEVFDATTDFADKPEIDRLRYFRETRASPALRDATLNGEDVRVTIMGEMVDPAHPDIANRVRRQYNAFSFKDRIVPGEGNRAWRGDLLGTDDGHGTHIAGTIAAECDGVGIRGIACGADLDVYNLGAYDNADQFPSEGWGDDDEEARFLTSFAKAMTDVARRGESRIVTGSFNLEAPAVHIEAGGPLEGRPLTEIIATIEEDGETPYESGLVTLRDPGDKAMLERLAEAHDDESVLFVPILTQSAEWAAVEDAIATYQAGDGVYLMTESNLVFEDRTSIMNAFPTLSNKVDPDLWLSIVMVVPEALEEFERSAANGDEKTEADVDAMMTKGYVAPLNTCGTMARDYCIVTPSWSVLSTMTERVASTDSPLITFDGRFYQSFDGHSMGAPMVAATLAVMEQENRRRNLGYSMKQLVRILKDTANRNFPGYDPIKHGRGMLDISAAIDGMGRS